MGRRRCPRRRARGGEDVPAPRSARTRITTALGAVACAGGASLVALLDAGDTALVVGVRLTAVAVVVLVAALVLEWSALVPVSLALAGAAYATHLALDDPALDVRAAALAALLLLAGELAYWSFEEAGDVAGEAGDSWRRLAVLLGMAAVSLLVAAGVLALVDTVGARGLVVDLAGAAAAAGALIALVVAAGRRPVG